MQSDEQVVTPPVEMLLSVTESMPESRGRVSDGLPTVADPFGIDGYEILSKLGAGGMGVVWRARQLGTGRDVALKVLAARQLHPAGRSQFVSEVRLCARLQHPHIARVYDSGIHEGLYYYAMELVEGPRLDRYVRDAQLTRRQVLGLMSQVCEAVGYAHQKGVIHRDLKPSNILVAPDGAPRVLDFGLAKAALEAGANGSGDGLTGDDSGAAAGTPAYMSPEQAAARGDLTDTRSDVYSLGKVLFELLTGEPAHLLTGLDESAVRRMVRDEPVRRPRAVSRWIDAELESLLLKATDRDLARRYGSAADLARDINHYLERRPLEAVGNAPQYVLRKWAARHRLAVGAIALTTVLVASLLTASYVSIAASEAAARRETGKLRAVTDFATYLLSTADPSNSGGRDITALLLERAQAEAKRFAGQPEIEAEFDDAIGQDFLGMGQFSAAGPMLERALILWGGGSASVDTLDPAGLPERSLTTMSRLAEVRRETGDLAGAGSLASKVLAQQMKAHRPGDRETLAAVEAMARVELDRGKAFEAANRANGALTLAQVTLPPDDPVRLRLLTILAFALRDCGRSQDLVEAEQLSQKVLDGYARLDAADHCHRRDVLESKYMKASVLTAAGRPDEAIGLYRQVLEEGERILTPGHPDLLTWRADLAAALYKKAITEPPLDAAPNLSEAESLYLKVLQDTERVRSADHPYTLTIKQNLAEVYVREKQRLKAEPLYRAVAARLEALHPKSPETFAAREALALDLMVGESPDPLKVSEARKTLEQDYNDETRLFGEQDPRTRATKKSLDWAIVIQKKLEETGGR